MLRLYRLSFSEIISKISSSLFFTQIKQKFRTKSTVSRGVLEEPPYVKSTLLWADSQPKWLVDEYRSLISLFLWLPMRLRQRIQSDLYDSIGKVPTHVGIILLFFSFVTVLFSSLTMETIPKFYIASFNLYFFFLLFVS